MTQRLREVPYNYTSFTDKEIVTRLLGNEMWETLNRLRHQRVTGRSARMLYEVLGDIWAVRRNPYLEEDLLENKRRRLLLIGAMRKRLDDIEQRKQGNEAVEGLLKAAHLAVDQFEDQLGAISVLRKKTTRVLKRTLPVDAIRFDAHSRISHLTDASDWRVEPPVAVFAPDNEKQIPRLVKKAVALGYNLIPRGGGTGYTGGAVPLHTNSAVINTEKLNQIGQIQSLRLPGHNQSVMTVKAGAGVVTRRMMELAEKSGYVFACDPTSADACCIGGNIAMNAGGKKAVLWGTALDNLASWRLVNADGEWVDVERINHNLGKIHDQKEVKFLIRRTTDRGQLLEEKTLVLPGDLFRKKGLGKDVSDKYLGGLPGVQKEGCDGIITSSVWLLHSMPPAIRTVCLEFFGSIREATNMIPATINRFKNSDEKSVRLAGLEHLDERYIKAVGYTAKAKNRGRPLMLLIGDLVGYDEKEVMQAASDLVKMANEYAGEGFIAVSDEARKAFWGERSRTAAISKHTNAFKLNEDVVIPPDRVGEYFEGVERINIELSLSNKITLCDKLTEYLLQCDLVTDSKIIDLPPHDLFETWRQEALDLIYQVQSRWKMMQENLDKPIVIDWLKSIDQKVLPKDIASLSIFSVLQKRILRVSWKEEIKKPLFTLFDGNLFSGLRDKLLKLQEEVLRERVFIALHMHAGDGNVHTNIPVNSDCYGMLQVANEAVRRVMELTKSLDGSVSGEHGIGLTKQEFLSEAELKPFWDYKNQVDPKSIFNRGKLMPNADLRDAYTPSFSLMGFESLILERTDLGLIADSIKNCLRCGKCKPVCATHMPRANLLYSPRDKILSLSLLIEARLYEEQTRRGVSTKHFKEFEDIADHCTVCHQCLTPCPVDIDFGDVSISMRNLLRKESKAQKSIAGKLAMFFLTTTSQKLIRLTRFMMHRVLYPSQRFAWRAGRLMGVMQSKMRKPPATLGKPSLKEEVVHFIARPLPKLTPSQSGRSLLGLNHDQMIPVIRDQKRLTEESEAVFYFPGCGSERLFSQIGLATQAMLYDIGDITVLPPGYLCCGYPQNASGNGDAAEAITVKNRVLFHRVANTLNYLDIKHVVVSCGTCYDQLLSYEFEKIFPGCELIDIHEYLIKRGVSLPKDGSRYVYHQPCHNPIKKKSSAEVVSGLLGGDSILSERCCGESGTLAVERPDISTQVRLAKVNSLRTVIHEERAISESRSEKVLTSCPSCLQGLARFSPETGLKSDYIVVELARKKWGESWMTQYIQKVKQGGIEQILL